MPSTLNAYPLHRRVASGYGLAMLTYRAGGGSDRRRKDIIKGGFSRPDLFEGIMKQFRDDFRLLSRRLQEEIQGAAAAYLGRIDEAMGILRNDDSLGQSVVDAEYLDAVRVATALSQNQSQAVLQAIAAL